MTYILSETEAATVLRTTETDPNMLDLLPLVDAYIQRATGRDWAGDNEIRPEAKAAARMLLVRWHEDPGGMAAGGSLGFGLSAALAQLEAVALDLESDGVPSDALTLVSTNISGDMATTASFILIFSHEMSSGATSFVTLEDANGSTVTTVNSLDATGKIMTVNPSASLTSGASYTIVIDQAPDIYGRTLEKEVGVTIA
jgi:hypothetical protein